MGLYLNPPEASKSGAETQSWSLDSTRISLRNIIWLWNIVELMMISPYININHDDIIMEYYGISLANDWGYIFCCFCVFFRFQHSPVVLPPVVDIAWCPVTTSRSHRPRSGWRSPVDGATTDLGYYHFIKRPRFPMRLIGIFDHCWSYQPRIYRAGNSMCWQFYWGTQRTKWI